MKFDDNGIQTPVEETDMERVLTPADLGNHIDYQAMQPELREGDWVSADGFGEGEIIRLLAPETGVALVRMDSFSKLVQPDDDGEVFIALNLLSKVEPEVVQSDPLIEAIITALQPGGERARSRRHRDCHRPCCRLDRRPHYSGFDAAPGAGFRLLLQPFRFLELPELDRNKLARELEALVRAGAPEEEE